MSKLYHIENSKTRGANSVDLDEVAHHEPPHQDLRCLQIQLFSSLVHEQKELICYSIVCLYERIVIVVVVLLFYVHGKHLRSCRDGQLT